MYMQIVTLYKCCIAAAPHLFCHYIIFFLILCLGRRVNFNFVHIKRKMTLTPATYAMW